MAHVSRKQAPKQEAKIGALINKPQRDWEPLWRAPYYCFLAGYIRAAAEWTDSLCAEVRQITSNPNYDDLTCGFPGLAGCSLPQFSLFPSRTDFSVSVTGMGICTRISPGAIYIFCDPDDLDNPARATDVWPIAGWSDAILKNPDWEEASNHSPGALWHKWLLGELLWCWQRHFQHAFQSGAICLMARKNSILAPFEPVTPDQWEFFRLDDNESILCLPEKPHLHDPREPFWVPAAKKSCTATGPCGERLFSIHVAKGSNTEDRLIRHVAAERECLHWLQGLMRAYPIRPPKPLPRLAKEAVSKFPGLSERGFFRCYATVKEETGNKKWSEAGAPSKSQRESPQNK
jgi:hypothetical protein